MYQQTQNNDKVKKWQNVFPICLSSIVFEGARTVFLFLSVY